MVNQKIKFYFQELLSKNTGNRIYYALTRPTVPKITINSEQNTKSNYLKALESNQKQTDTGSESLEKRNITKEVFFFFFLMAFCLKAGPVKHC